MKLNQLFKFAGLLVGTAGAIMILFGFIGYFVGPFLNVQNFANFFWYANPLLMFGIFGLLASFACKDKEKQ